MTMATRVMIDGFNLALDKGTGVATYARNLSHELHIMGLGVDVLYGKQAYNGRDLLRREVTFYDTKINQNVFLKFLSSGSKFIISLLTTPTELPINGQVITRTYASRLPYADRIWNWPNVFGSAEALYYTTGITRSLRMTSPPDIMHWTYPLPIRTLGARNIYTIHDLVPLRLPYTTGDHKIHYLKLMRHLVKKADHIVTVSETSRRDIISLLGCPEDRVTNTYQSVEIPAKLREKPDDVVRREVEGAFGLTYKNYFLFYGAIEPKKNIGRLIEAYLASGVTTPLVIVGAEAWKAETELRLLNEKTNQFTEQIENRYITRERVRRFDYAPFPLLVSLIRGAKAVTFPSLYEGFGLPVLEAMLLGTPVITSREGSTPEVAGEAAILIDPYDPRTLSEAIIEVDRNAELRDRLSAAGRAQAALYSPEAYRGRLKDLYGKVLQRPV